MVRLDDIAEVLMGATPGNGDEAVPYVRMSAIGEAGIAADWVATAPAPVKGQDSRLLPGDVLVRGKGREVAVARVDQDHAGAYATADTYVVRPREGIDCNYLIAVIRSGSVDRQLAAGIQGTNLVRLTREALAGLQFPCPPLATQIPIGRLAADAESEIKIIDELRSLRSRLHTELLQRALEKAHAEDCHPRRGLTPEPADASAKGSPIHPEKQKAG